MQKSRAAAIIHYRAAAFAIAAAMLAACGGSQPLIGNPGAAPQIEDTPIGRPWMSPNAKKMKKLLYISSFGENAVYVYDYKTEELVGKLTGLPQPAGQCVDRDGNVWVTDYAGVSGSPTGYIVEYAHGGSRPLKVLNTYGYTIGCSIDPTSGNLAVANFYVENGPADILVFKNASGRPKIYASDDCTGMLPPGYDQNGNLYVESYKNSGIGVCELPHGGKALRSVSFNAHLDFLSSVMWDGKYITLASELQYSAYSVNTVIYQMTEDVSGNLTEVGKSVFTDDCGGFGDEIKNQAFIVGNENTPINKHQGNVVIGGNAECMQRFGFWNYPSGGNPKKTLPSPPIPYAFGESVSIIR